MEKSWPLELHGQIQEHVYQLPKVSDEIVTVLKGHLLIEEKINDLIKKRLPNPEPLLKARPRFSHKLSLLESLIVGQIKKTPRGGYSVRKLWHALRELNTIRNEIAHDLAPKRLQKKVKDLTLAVLDLIRLSDKLKDIAQWETIDQLKWNLGLLAFLVGAMSKE